MNVLPPGRRAEPGYQARWLWRTLRAAELAGLDPARILAEAIAERDLAGSRDVAAVIDARIRHRLGSVVPLPPRPWSGQIPAITDPDRRAYAGQIAALTPPGAQRHLAVAADAELRRRHPDQRFTPLRSAEPPAVTAARRAELTLTAGPDILEAGPWIKDLDAGRRSFAARGGRGCWLA